MLYYVRSTSWRFHSNSRLVKPNVSTYIRTYLKWIFEVQILNLLHLIFGQSIIYFSKDVNILCCISKTKGVREQNVLGLTEPVE